MLVQFKNDNETVVFVNPLQVSKLFEHWGYVNVPGQGRTSVKGVLICLSGEQTVFVPGVSVGDVVKRIDDALPCRLS